MPNILVSLKEPITAPDGEEYKAVWGYNKNDLTFEIPSVLQVGEVKIAKDNVAGIIPCPGKPANVHQKSELTKAGLVPISDPIITNPPNIYYSE